MKTTDLSAVLETPYSKNEVNNSVSSQNMMTEFLKKDGSNAVDTNLNSPRFDNEDVKPAL